MWKSLREYFVYYEIKRTKKCANEREREKGSAKKNECQM